MSARFIRVTVAVLAVISRAYGQEVAPAATTSSPVVAPAGRPDSLAAVLGTSYLDNNIKGYGKAEILGSDGKTNFVYVPINPDGFGKYLPFHRSEADVRRFGKQPFSIDVDKVQSIKINGLYQEHIVLKGKRKHILATRLVKGPVELFCYAEIIQPVSPGMAGGGLASIAVGTGVSIGVGVEIGASNRYWYLRRAGEGFVRVIRTEFKGQMMDYFHDDPELVAAFSKEKLHYKDMVKVVEAYNEYLGRPISGESARP